MLLLLWPREDLFRSEATVLLLMKSWPCALCHPVSRMVTSSSPGSFRVPFLQLQKCYCPSLPRFWGLS